MPPPPPSDGEMEGGTEETGCAVGVPGAFVPGTPPQTWRLFAAARPLLLLVLVLGCCLGDLRSDAQRLPQEEVEALRRIAVKLRKPAEQWDFREDPCSGTGGWVNVTGPQDHPRISNVTCDCTFNDSTVCHVISLKLVRQNLTGVLPEEIANLTYLRFLDLSRNYLNGTIPPAWASLPLFNLTLLGNRLSGSIPVELGSMPVLKSLNLENNRLQGPIPPEIGNLVSLERFFISGNFITGELPISFANLTSLGDFRIDGNLITGKIPDFIHNWSQVNRIDMQGTSMYGPIPSSISSLRNLTELRICDLSGPSINFPPLQNAEHLTELVLRNCSISGEIPSYVGAMRYLKVLDLSFNKLTGLVPSNFEGLRALEYMYLTSNMLIGEIPPWMLRNRQSNKINMDISYNNFTGTAPSDCQLANLNLVVSFSNSNDNSIPPCLRRNLPCPSQPQYSSLFINCGGPNIVVGGKEYQDDSSQIGTSTFHADRSGRWAYSSTGDFIANQNADYIVTNTSTLNTVYPDLYKDARLAPISLKYYGLCLLNGDYLIGLHFTEIMFTADETYSSLGRRLFDVLIQGERVLKDFNIEDAAGGPGRVIVMNFTTRVTSNALEIHLYWAGKGTNAIPERGGVYGPLISAISVTLSSNSKIDGGKNGFPVGAILGIVGAGLLFICIFLYLHTKGCFRRLQCGKKGRHSHEPQGRPNYYFSIEQIEMATDGFDSAKKIGEGGFGPVYKGRLEDGTLIAVKRHSSHSNQGNREFLNEIGMISALHHPNLVKLFGCCVEENQLLLIYEYMQNNSLGRALFGHEEHRLKLDWSIRYAICLGVAKGLAYLHEESTLKIVHRDIKATNILLDKNLNPKISDFGLAKLYEKENTHISTRVAGTVGYMAPEYATRGYLTDKADVYSFGVVVLEIVTGKSNTNYAPDEKFLHLLDWAFLLLGKGRLIELVDPKLSADYPEEEAIRLLNVALLCTNSSPTQRPTMSIVVSMLTGETAVPTPVKTTSEGEDWIVGALRKLSSDSHLQSAKLHNSPNDSVLSLHEDEKAAFYPSTSGSCTDTSATS